MAEKEKSWTKVIEAYVLKNAVEHEGKAQEGSVIAGLFHEGLKKEDVKDIINEVKLEVKKVNSLSLEQQKEEFAKSEKLTGKREEREGLQELPNIKGKLVLRLAPFPSGALHIGNAKTYLLNALYAEKYKGKLLLVIDDTIGSKEKRIIKEAYKLIPDAFDWLKVKYKKPIIYKSDRLKIYYKYAEELIKLGKAYVCDCKQEKLKENRENGIECSCRQFPVKSQLTRWKEMFKSKPGKFTLRLKTSMQDKNPAFRDRVLFKISDLEHPKVGTKYKVWPMLEFSWAVDDHLLGITHIIRGKDLMIESDMEKFIWDIFSWKHPEIIHAGLVRIEGIEAKISKSKAQKEILSGEFIGWDDPRTWSVQSLRRRGFLPESIREFIGEIGLNQNDIIVPIEKLYAINRKFLDLQAERYPLIENPVKIEIDKNPVKEIQVKVHPDKKETRKLKVGAIFISGMDYENFKDKEVRLMHLCNIKLKDDYKADFIGMENKEIPRISWVSEFVNVKILMPDVIWVGGITDIAAKKLKPGSKIQFERFGFARFDEVNEAGEYKFWFAHR